MHRMKYAVLLPFLACFAGCGDYSNMILQEDLEFLYAVPAKSTLEIRVAEQENREVELFRAEGSLSSQSSAVLGETATFYLLTLAFSIDVNKNVFGFLDLADLIVSFPPTAREKDTRLWGPWPSADSPNTDWRFVMQRDRESGLYDFTLQVNSVAKRNTPAYTEGWQHCLYGSMDPTEDSFRRGTGNLTADVETCGQYEDSGEQGTASIGFDTSPDEDNPEGKTHLSIQFADFVSKDMYEENPDPQPINALYSYEENGDYSGVFDFDAWTDLDAGENPDHEAREHVVIKTQWDSSGAGRADSVWSDGDLGALELQIHECWDAEKKRVYYSDSHDLNPSEGDPGDCALLPASFD